MVHETGRPHAQAEVDVVPVPPDPGAPEPTDRVEHAASQHQAVPVECVDRLHRDARRLPGGGPEPQIHRVDGTLADAAVAGRAPPPGPTRLLRRRPAEAEHPGAGDRLGHPGQDVTGGEVQPRILVEEAEQIIGAGPRALDECVVAAGDVGRTFEGHEPVRAAVRREVGSEVVAARPVAGEGEDDQHPGGQLIGPVDSSIAP